MSSTVQSTFGQPPVVERVLTVQFGELDRFGVIHYGLWFREAGDPFVEATWATRLTRMTERFPFRPPPDYRLELSSSPTGRLAARSGDGVWQMQVQPDRFSLSCRHAEGDEYPGFGQILHRFGELFTRFGQFCEAAGLSAPAADSCEVTYVNRMPSPDGVAAAEDFATVFGIDPDGPAGVRGGRELSAWTYDRVFDFPAERVRLYAEAAAMFASGSKPTPADGSLFRLIGRAMIGPDEQPLVRLGAAHDRVVEGFVDLTSDAIRFARWEQVS